MNEQRHAAPGRAHEEVGHGALGAPRAARAWCLASSMAVSLAVSVVALGCGGDDAPCEPVCAPPPDGCEYRRFLACECGTLVCEDAGPMDGGTIEDAEVDDAELDAADADIGDVGSIPLDACSSPVCPLPPAGCRFLPNDDPCVCPEVDCGCGTRPGPDGPEPIVCGPMEFCHREAPVSCAGPGECRPRPMSPAVGEPACPSMSAPVCTCNGNTFGNACLAQSAGETPATAGACVEPPVPDCRMGATCTETEDCRGCTVDGVEVWSCRPRGLDCPGS